MGPFWRQWLTGTTILEPQTAQAWLMLPMQCGGQVAFSTGTHHLKSWHILYEFLEQMLKKGLLQKICLSSELPLPITTALMKVPNGQRCLRCSSSRFLFNLARCNYKAYKLSGTANIWGWVLWYSWELIDFGNSNIGPKFYKPISHQYNLLIQWLRMQKTPSASFLSTLNFIFNC